MNILGKTIVAAACLLFVSHASAQTPPTIDPGAGQMQMDMVTDPCTGEEGQYGFTVAGVNNGLATQYPTREVCNPNSTNLELQQTKSYLLLLAGERLSRASAYPVTGWTDSREQGVQTKVYLALYRRVAAGSTMSEALIEEMRR